ncbi:MAG: hypothetical protein ACFFFH_16265 [Candidatus Thorarchaeota archaeon]
MRTFGRKKVLIKLKLWHRLFILFNCVLLIIAGLIIIQTGLTTENEPSSSPANPIFGVFCGIVFIGGSLVGLYVAIRKESITLDMDYLPKTPTKFVILLIIGAVLTILCGFLLILSPQYSLLSLIGIIYGIIFTYLAYKGMQLYSGGSVKPTLPPKICPECKFMNKSDSTQCTNCGAIISNPDTQ